MKLYGLPNMILDFQYGSANEPHLPGILCQACGAERFVKNPLEAGPLCRHCAGVARQLEVTA